MSARKKHAYSKSGVDIFKADRFVDFIKKIAPGTFSKSSKKNGRGVEKSVGGFASLYRISDEYSIAATTDGVGTKLKLAFESGVHNTVGIDLVAMCANDLICVGAEPLFFLDYFATGKLDLKVSNAVISGIVEGCKQAHLALVGGETAEMPGFYKPGEYDLAGFAVGLIQKNGGRRQSSRQSPLSSKNKHFPTSMAPQPSTIRSGDAIIGLASSGPHSNGFSLIRQLLTVRDGKLVKDQFFKKCMKPTTIYVDVVRRLCASFGQSLKGFAHITGSGFLNIPRISESWSYKIEFPVGNTPQAQKVFWEIQQRGGLSLYEMATTFNMGIGFVIIVDKAVAPKVVSRLRALGQASYVIGSVVKSKGSGSVVEVSYANANVRLKY